MKYCSQCGQPVEEGTLYCSYCGAPQAQDQTDQQMASQEAPQTDSSMNQGYAQPNQNMNQGYAQPNQNMNQGYTQPNQNMNQGYAQPNQNMNQGYAQPNQNMNQGYAQPNQNMNQGYAQPNQNMNQGYAQPNQNYGQGYGQFNGQSYNPNGSMNNGQGFGNKVSGVVEKVKLFVGSKVNLADKKTRIILISAASLVLLLIIALICGLNMRGASSYKGAVNKLMKGLEAGSGKKVVHAMMPRKMEKAMDDELQDGDLEGMGYDSTVDFIEDMFDEELEDGVKIRKVDITDKDKQTKKQIRDFQEDIEDELGVKIKVSQAYELDIEYEYREKGDKKWSDEDMTVTAYKTGGRWYIFPL